MPASLAIRNPQSQIQNVIVAIPAYNEESRIITVVKGCRARGVEVWVVDDGSSDQSADRARQAGARVLSHGKNLGKGMAIRTAIVEFLKASHDFLIFMDADGQHDPAHLDAFVETARRTEAAIVLGNRMGSAENMPAVRRLTNQSMSWILSRFARQKVPDSQCGYRLLTRSFAAAFRPTTAHFELESEMIIQAGRMGLHIESVPITTLYQGQVSHIHPLRDTVRFLKMLLRYLSTISPLPLDSARDKS